MEFDDLNWIQPPPIINDNDDLETTRQLDEPRLYRVKNRKREFVNGLKKEALNVLIPELPPSDTDLYVIGNGSGAEIRHGVNPLAFDFGHFIPHVVRLLGDRACSVYISTWTMNRTHVKSILERFDDGAIAQLTVFTDPYFRRREAAIATELVTGLLARGQRYLAFKNHCKIITIRNPEGACCTITGSANLSAQPRCEQYVLSTAPDIYEFFVTQFFEAMLTNV